jgi:hypothetical protein
MIDILSHDGVAVICNVPGGIGNYPKDPWLLSLQYLKVGVCGYAPELDTVWANGFQYSILFSSDSCEFLPVTATFYLIWVLSACA